jgi:gamma-glutamyl:cysteine ligase YbdK (ATP-grasp superfamily)
MTTGDSQAGGAHHLFDVVGIEIEYMIVDRADLRVRPISDELIRAACGRIESEIEMGALAWSNELAMHVIELKTNGPAPSVNGLAAAFQADVRRINGLLEPLGAMLLPTGMHPTMDPHREMRLWPHEYSPVYEAFNRIFDCRGHGWGNLQAVHINLPFANDEEFGRLHAAIRFALPILPALAASTPIADGRPSGFLDTRLEHYRHNARRVPSVAGEVVPEPVFTRADYETLLLGKIYRDLAPHDPQGILRHEWANARGCIARFDRSAIEIRVLDVTECPRSDLAIAAGIIALVRALVDERFASSEAQRRWPTSELASLWLDVVREGDRALVKDPAYREAFGLSAQQPCTVGELWQSALARCEAELPADARDALATVLAEGCLARRITRRMAGGASLPEVYRELAACLARGELFHAPPTATHL